MLASGIIIELRVVHSGVKQFNGSFSQFLMYHTLYQYIEVRTGEKLPENEKELICSAFTQKRMRKRQFFLQEGDVCKQLGFIVKGSARMFSVDEKGHEHVIHFGLESSWITDPESSIQLIPSKYFIEMLEDSEVMVISVPSSQELRSKSRCFDLTVKAIDKHSTIAIQKRIHAAIGMTAEERFSDLSQNNPEYLERFPMNMIASYLGLSPETLSRIRKNALRK